MTADWYVGLLQGLAIGLPLGAMAWAMLGPVDRWLDDHRGR